MVVKKVWSLFFVVSMSTKWKNSKFYYKIDDKYFYKDSYIILSQALIIDKKRFVDKIWRISWNDFRNIKKELQNILF